MAVSLSQNCGSILTLWVTLFAPQFGPKVRPGVSADQFPAHADRPTPQLPWIPGEAEWLAFTYGAQGVRVSCICPGAVDTAMLRAGAAGDAARASAVIGGGDVLTPAAAAQRILDAVAEDRFLILTHPEMQDFMVGKAQDPERWIRGMTKLWSRAQALLS